VSASPPLLTLFGCAALAACSGPTKVISASDAGARSDALSPTDGSSLADRSAPLLWVDFAGLGCDTGGDNGRCVATAPARLGFVAASPARIDTFVWSFGDGTPNDDRAVPEHTFEHVGLYDVALTVGGPGGTAERVRAGFVEIIAAPVGGRCQRDDQCDGDLECICDEAASCPAGLAGGVCSTHCSPSSRCPAGVCARLNPSGAGPAEEWSQSLCLQECTEDAQCPQGLACRFVRDGGGDGWVQACFAASLLADIGAACLNESGSPDPSLCASGQCVAEGARGMCTYSCTSASCPSYAACATFSGPLGSLCLARCSEEVTCTDDPWLSCEDPGGTGAKSFTVAETASAGGYCAPRRCASSVDCGPDGQCTAGFCGPAP
jgi:PKD repeat protein